MMAAQRIANRNGDNTRAAPKMINTVNKILIRDLDWVRFSAMSARVFKCALIERCVIGIVAMPNAQIVGFETSEQPILAACYLNETLTERPTMFNVFKRGAGTLISIFAMASPGLVWAQSCEQAAAVNLSATSSEDVNNDMVRLHWQIQAQGNSANEVMNQVNRALNDSIATLSKNREVSKLRNNIQTYPQYGKDRSIQGWQATGSLSFEMKVQALKDQGALGISKGLALGNLDYFPSDQALETSRTKLLESAMKQFQDKAALVSKGFGKAGYSLSEISINDDNIGRPVPVFARAYSAPSDMMGKSAMEVASASGASQVNVGVSGRVCLKP